MPMQPCRHAEGATSPVLGIAPSCPLERHLFGLGGIETGCRRSLSHRRRQNTPQESRQNKTVLVVPHRLHLLRLSGITTSALKNKISICPRNIPAKQLEDQEEQQRAAMIKGKRHPKEEGGGVKTRQTSRRRILVTREAEKMRQDDY